MEPVYQQQQQPRQIGDAQAPPVTQQQTQYGAAQTAAQDAPSGVVGLLKQWMAPILRDSRELLVSKLFYLFFFAAFGSLFPLLGVYFKQLGMNALQCGILMGIRPLIEYLSSPFWAGVAERYRKGKMILLCSLASWLLFTMSFNVVQPPATSCITFNKTHHLLYPPNTNEIDLSETEAVNIRPKRETMSIFWLNDDPDVEEIADPSDTETEPRPRNKRGGPPQHWNHRRPGPPPPQGARTPLHNRRRPAQQLPPNYVIGKSPNTVEYTLNYNKEKHETYVSPPFSSVVYRQEDVQAAFFLMILLVILGEFFSSPAITLADSVTLTYLADRPDDYGRQRMFGSIGWAVAMLFLGIALDRSTSFSAHPCAKPSDRERNYNVCFATFSFLMFCAFIVATQFRFDYETENAGNEQGDQSDVQMKQLRGGSVKVKNSQRGFSNEITIEDIAPGIPSADQVSTDQQHADPEPAKSNVFAHHMRHLPQIMSVLHTVATPRYATFLLAAWCLGFGIGLVFTFLFWHLQDLDGTPTLFGLASVVNHISEIGAFFFSYKFIRKWGHQKVLCFGLTGNVLRFLYLAYVSNPWLVLPFELLQGVTHSAVWAACVSYVGAATPAGLRTSATGVLQGLHHGFGRASGAVIGGFIITQYGTQMTFLGYSLCCLIVLAAFISTHYTATGQGEQNGFMAFETDHPAEAAAGAAHLAPHGVPSSPMARSLSKQNLGNQAPQQAAADTKTQGGYLAVP